MEEAASNAQQREEALALAVETRAAAMSEKAVLLRTQVPKETASPWRCPGRPIT